jgi:NAD(P)-dependent dehydrogenase (short-subunit alcohol dehydrogenase family)
MTAASDVAGDSLARFRLDGKVACITGGAAGIGAATAELMAAAGATVVVLDRDEETARATAAAIGGPCEAQALDVASEPAVVDTFAAVAERHGRIDILVANAGINIRRTALECTVEDWNAVLQVNLTGVFLTARTAARHMPESGGAVVSTASIMSFSGGGLYPNIAYMTTKGALVNLTRALAVEWAGRNIRVNAVAPTWTRTSFIQPLLDDQALIARLEAMTPMRRLAEPEEVAHAMLFLASSAASMVTGHVLTVDGGFLAQ